MPNLRALLILVAALPAMAFAQKFTTQRFDVDVALAKDRTFVVTETIEVTFTEPQRGLIRRIPYRTEGGGKTREVAYDLVTVLAETRAGSTSPPVHERWDRGDWVLRIGDPEQTLKGPVTYRISYRVSDALTDFKDSRGERTEFFWNLMGGAVADVHRAITSFSLLSRSKTGSSGRSHSRRRKEDSQRHSVHEG